MERAAIARQFRQRHHTGEILILPNVWDAGSARLFAAAGAEAIATTSSGLSWSNGYADGNDIPVKVLAASVRLIARVVSVPVSVDAEGGYSADADQVFENLVQLIDAGASGFNLEDGAGTVDDHCRRIEAARRAAEKCGVPVFINARTDVFLRGFAPQGKEVEETLARARAYAAAGADGLFVPNAVRAEDIRALAAGQALPLNVMARPALVPLSELKTLGVARLSAGGAIAQSALGHVERLARSFLKSGSTPELYEGAITFAEANRLFAR